jgi:hypothetical protein
MRRNAYTKCHERIYGIQCKTNTGRRKVAGEGGKGVCVRSSWAPRKGVGEGRGIL